MNTYTCSMLQTNLSCIWLKVVIRKKHIGAIRITCFNFRSNTGLVEWYSTSKYVLYHLPTTKHGSQTTAEEGFPLKRTKLSGPDVHLIYIHCLSLRTDQCCLQKTHKRYQGVIWKILGWNLIYSYFDWGLSALPALAGDSHGTDNKMCWRSFVPFL